MAGEPESHSRPGAPLLQRGAPIGRYLVVGLVGRGAMGEVYAAYDPELDRKVAVKLLHVRGGITTDTAEQKARLLGEAQAIARLSHPNVVVVHDVGSFGERVFVAMEFVDGNTLSYWLHASKRSWREILDVFVSAGRGLAAAHDADLVHRDFKGENVMITASGQVRVMDFGLARPASQRRSGNSVRVLTTVPDVDPGSTIELPTHIACRVGAALESSKRSGAGAPADPAGAPIGPPGANLTETGALVGTPAYMAPEQFRGLAADARSDQFSFCVALYEALYGERPFRGSSMIELADSVTNGRLRPPPVTKLVPGWVRRAVLRGLATEPEARWPSMAALLGALAHSPRARGWWYVAASAAVAGSVAASLALGWVPAAGRSICQPSDDRFAGVWERGESRGSRRAAISQSMNASGNPRARETFDKLARLLDNYVSRWGRSYRDTCEATNLRGEQSHEVLDLKMSCLRDRVNELHALSDVLLEDNAVVVTNALGAATALTPVEGCADITSAGSTLAAPGDPATRQRVDGLRTRLLAAKASQDAGRYAHALDEAVRIVADARKVGYEPVIAEALNRLALLQIDTGRTGEANATVEEALWLAEGSRHDELVVELSSAEIFVAGYIEHDMVKAQRWINQARVFLQRIGGHDLLRAWMLNNIGVALDANGDPKAAAGEFLAALRIKERVLGKDDPDVAFTLSNLADALNATGRSKEALEVSNRGVEILERTFGASHPRLVAQLVNRAEILNQLGRHEDARRDAEQAVAIQRSGSGPAANLIYALLPLGEAEMGLGHAAKAIAPLRQAVQLAEESSIDDQLPKLRFALARALWDSGRDRRGGRALVVLVAERGQDAKVAKNANGANSASVAKGVKDDVAVAAEDPIQRRAQAWLAAHLER